MANGFAADVGLGHFLHGDGALNPGRNTGLLEAVLEGDGIHHRGEHAHVVGGGAVHAGGRSFEAAEDIAAAHHDGQLGPFGHHAGDVLGNGLNDRWINPIALLAHQRFAAEFEEHALVTH